MRYQIFNTDVSLAAFDRAKHQPWHSGRRYSRHSLSARSNLAGKPDAIAASCFTYPSTAADCGSATSHCCALAKASDDCEPMMASADCETGMASN